MGLCLSHVFSPLNAGHSTPLDSLDLGLLSQICLYKCVQPAQLFVNRILQVLRNFPVYRRNIALDVERGYWPVLQVYGDTYNRITRIQTLNLSHRNLCKILYLGVAFKAIVSSTPEHQDSPLFAAMKDGKASILTASRVRIVLRCLVTAIGHIPGEFGFMR